MAETSQTMKKMSSNSILSDRRIEETQWIVEINKLIERDDLETALKTPFSIFKIPDSVTNEKPECYFPHSLALGPYHHFNPQLYKMEIFKLEKAKERFKLPYPFNQIVNEKLIPLDLKIRACFDKHLEMESEALAWTMLIDGMFLLRLLTVENTTILQPEIANEDDSEYDSDTDYIECEYVDGSPPFYIDSEHDSDTDYGLPMFKDQKLYDSINKYFTSQCEIVKDILMLENQIPTLVLKEISQTDHFHLHEWFHQFCKSFYPVGLPDNHRSLKPALARSHHLLHFLYLLIINHETEKPMAAPPRPMPFEGGGRDSTSFSQKLSKLLAAVSQVDFLNQVKEVIDIIQSLFLLIQTLFGSIRKDKKSSSRREEDSSAPMKMIPSASKLKKVKLKFRCKKRKGMHKPAEFDSKERTLTLSVITINLFSEVIFRNLMAFEKATIMKKDPYLTQYIGLMSWLIETPKDVTILKEANILNFESQFGSDEDIVKMFNGFRNTIGSHYMSLIMESNRSLQSGYVSKPTKMAEIIKEINKYYESHWTVKAKRFMKKYIWSALKVVFYLIMIFLLLFVLVRTFCDWFSCPKVKGKLH